ncbi:MAG: organic hydroperoxide resistance protein [Solirubrobacteraceae bacterium]
MGNPIYTALATVTGGREGRGASSDGKLDVKLALPPQMGGDGDGTNPEQLFAVGYAACFEGALGFVGTREGADVAEVSIDSSVTLLPTDSGGFKLQVQLAVTLPRLGEQDAVQLVSAADAVCPYSNALRGNVEVTLLANGRRVD